MGAQGRQRALSCLETDAKIRSFLVGGGRLRTIAEDCGGLWTIYDTSGRVLGGYGAANYVLIGAIRAIGPIRAIRALRALRPIREGCFGG